MCRTDVLRPPELLSPGAKLPRGREADCAADTFSGSFTADFTGVRLVLSIFFPPLSNFPNTLVFLVDDGTALPASFRGV